MMARDIPEVVMRFDGLRRSCFDPLPPQTKTPRIIGDRASPYHAAPYIGIGLREQLHKEGASTPRTGTSGNKVRRLTRPSTSGSARPSKRLGLQADGDDLERKDMPPPFQSSVVSMVADLRDKTLTVLGKDSALISQSELAAQQSQVMHTCEMLGDIANMVAKAERGRSTRVVGDALKETVVEQQRLVNSLKEQIAAQQHYSLKVAARCKQLETELETAKRRLKNEMKKSYDLEVQNKELRIKVLDAQMNGTQKRERGGDVHGIYPSLDLSSGEFSGEAPLASGPGDEPAMTRQPTSAQPADSEVLTKRLQGTEVKEQRDRVAALCAAASWTWDFTELQSLICSSVGAHAFRLLVRNYLTGGLVSSADDRVNGALGSIGSLFRIGPADSTSSLAARTADVGQSIMISDLGADERRHPNIDVHPWDDVKTCMLSVPISHEMMVEGEARAVVIGVMQVAARGQSGFDDQTKRTIEVLAGFCAEPLAVRLKNEAKILDFSMKARTIAERVAATVAGSYDLALIAPVIEEHVNQVFVCDVATVLWVNRVEPPMLDRVSGGEVISIPMQGLTGQCIETGKEISVSNLQSFPGYMEEFDSLPEHPHFTGSLLLIPIFGTNQQPIGVLRLLSAIPGAFEGFEAHSINSIRTIAALGLGSVIPNSTATISRRHRSQITLQDAADRPLHRLCRQVHSQMSAALGGKEADILFYSVDEIQYQVQRIPYLESMQADTEELNSAEIGTGLCGDTALTGQVSRVARTAMDRRFVPQKDAVSPTVSNKASLWVPLRNFEGHVTGVAAVYVDSDDDFQKDGAGTTILRLCHEFAPYFSDLVYMDSLETERQRWKAVTQEIVPIFDSPEVSDCVAKVKAAFLKVFKLGRCQHWTFDARTAMLTYSPGRGAGKDVSVNINGPDQLCKSARSGQVFVVPVASIEDDAAEARQDLRGLPNSANNALMVVPLMDSSQKPNLVIQAERSYSFTPVEVSMMQEMSRIGALAIEHASVLETETVPGTRQFEEAMVLALTVEDAMRETMAACRKMCQCTNAVVFWPSPDGSSMCQYYCEAGQVKMKTFLSTSGIAAECLAERKPMLLGDSREHLKFHPGMDGLHDLEPVKPGDENMPLDPIQAIYYPVVLKNSNESIAVMCVREKKRGMAFNRQDIICLGVLARQTALTLRNVEKHEGLLEIARTRDIRHAQMGQLNSIRTMQMEAIASVSSHTPVNSVMKRMGDAMCEILDVEVCKLHLVEEGGKVVRTLGDMSLQNREVEVAKSAESDIVCRVLRDNETVLFDLSTMPDLDLDDVNNQAVRFEVDGVAMLNSLTVPLRDESGQVFAILQLVNKRQVNLLRKCLPCVPRKYATRTARNFPCADHPEDLAQDAFTGSDELVVHMAASAYKTVLDASLLSEVRFEIGLGSVESKPDDISYTVLAKALNLVAANAGQVLLLVDNRTQLRRYAQVSSSGERLGGKRGFTPHTHSSGDYSATQGLAGIVVQTRSTLNIPELREESRFDSGIDVKLDFEGSHSFVCCPLLTSTGECMGVIQLVKSGIGQFTERELRLLQVLSKQAGMMIWNRERYEHSVQSSLQQVKHVSESVLWCLEMQPNIDLLVNRIVENAINIVPCENAAIFFRGKTTLGQEHVWTKIANKSEEVWPYKKRPNRTAFSGRKAHRDVKIPLHNGIMAEALKTRKHVEVHRPDSRLVLGYQSLTTTEVNNMLVVPIFRNANDVTSGVLILVNKREGFVLDDARKLEHYRSAIFPCVECICRCEGFELPDFLATIPYG